MSEADDRGGERHRPLPVSEDVPEEMEDTPWRGRLFALGLDTDVADVGTVRGDIGEEVGESSGKTEE